MKFLPYTDADVSAAMRTVVSSQLFEQVARFVYPEEPVETVRQRLLSITSVQQCQMGLMRDAFERVKSTFMTDFTYSISPLLRPDEAYLYIANHRDITLDAMILENVLCANGFPTSQVAFGANLIDIPMIAELGRVNKLFSVERGGTPREYYASLLELSHYIHDAIERRHESVWIAQRNGRTKNGLDLTDPAIVKMFALGRKEPLCSVLEPLHLVPVTVSYQWEPCDALKAIELAKRRHGSYHKVADEDRKSVVSGFLSPKGHVHLAIGDPIDARALRGCDDDPKAVAEMLDGAIVAGYRLADTNYCASDLRSGTKRHAERYGASVAEEFRSRLDALRATAKEASDGQPDDFVEAVLAQYIDIYANPVDR